MNNKTVITIDTIPQKDWHPLAVHFRFQRYIKGAPVAQFEKYVPIEVPIDRQTSEQIELEVIKLGLEKLNDKN